MPILTERTIWRRERPRNQTRRSSDLSLAEQENVRVALRFLHTRLGSWQRVAEAMKAHRPTLRDRMYGRTVTGGLALRVARLAAVPLEDILTGRWPVAGTCPHCGRL